MSDYQNKETIIYESKDVIVSLVYFPVSSRSPVEEVVLYVKETIVSESRQVVLSIDQARNIGYALLKSANIVEDELIKLHTWEDEGGAVS